MAHVFRRSYAHVVQRRIYRLQTQIWCRKVVHKPQDFWAMLKCKPATLLQPLQRQDESSNTRLIRAHQQSRTLVADPAEPCQAAGPLSPAHHPCSRWVSSASAQQQPVWGRTRIACRIVALCLLGGPRRMSIFSCSLNWHAPLQPFWMLCSAWNSPG